jgi:hypothetical protein
MADAPVPLDVSIVSGARPDLLDRTLSSFGSRLLKNFRLGRVVANIDMIFGSRTDCSACVDVILTHFPNADIRIPATSSFGEAVKSNWSRTRGDFVLHLEDDWILNEDVDNGVMKWFAPHDVKQVSFLNKEKNWDIQKKGYERFEMRKQRLFGLQLRKVRFPIFTMAPSIIVGDFARSSALLMNGELDAEKQFARGINPKLEAHVRRHRSIIVAASDGQPLISDIGREWRLHRRIEKSLVGGRPQWTT